MPIKAKNKHLYPGGSPTSKEWKVLRADILTRAANKCERCSAKNHELIVRSLDRATYMYFDTGEVRCSATGTKLGRARFSDYQDSPLVKVVLTIAHIDQNPANNDHSNLQALCQRCHNLLDAPHRQRNAERTRRGRKASGDLFL